MDKLTTECVSDRSLGSKVDFGSNRATPIDEALNANPIQGFVNNISESQSKVSMENVPRHLVHEKQRDSTFEGMNIKTKQWIFRLLQIGYSD
ncbi:hypothetical protein CsSME_00007810 [Camellia sinensis var. sinensis]